MTGLQGEKPSPGRKGAVLDAREGERPAGESGRPAGEAGEPAADAERRAAGTLYVLAVPDAEDPAFQEAVAEQLKAVSAWWQDGSGPVPGFRRVEAPEVLVRHDVECFLHAAGVRDTPAEEPLVLYLTGHGAVGASGRHFLLLPDTDRRRLLATALRTSEVVTAALDSHAEHVLVIVNTCEAEGVAAEVQELIRELDTGRTARGSLNVLATTAHRTTVLGREFSEILREAHRWLSTAAGITRPYLTVGEFVQALEHGTDRLRRARDAAAGEPRLGGPRMVHAPRQTDPVPTLPNPGYPPPRRTGVRAARPVGGDGGTENWVRRASGALTEDDTGWFFSGRREVNRALVTFLAGPPGSLLVTGTAGSGKSAVLARLVALGDPAFRASPQGARALEGAESGTVPEPGAVHVALHARMRSARDLWTALLGRLGLSPDTGTGGAPVSRGGRLWPLQERLFRFLAEPGPHLTIVVDGLDEAADPGACVRDFLVPLGRAAVPGPEAPAGGAPGVPEPRATEGAPGGRETRAAGSAAGVPEPRPGQAVARPRGRRGVRLLLGVRSSAPPTPGGEGRTPGGNGRTPEREGPAELLHTLRGVLPDPRVVRTDEEPVTADIAEYVAALLRAAGWEEEAAARAAARVAASAGRSFLDARLAAAQLREPGGPALPADPRWLSRLGHGTVGLLEADLAALPEPSEGAEATGGSAETDRTDGDRAVEGRSGGLDREEALALLRATAFAQGRGLPWAEVWPTVAGALLGRALPDPDEKIRRLLSGRLAGYLAHDTEDDRRVYRPAHERLAAVLRQWPPPSAAEEPAAPPAGHAEAQPGTRTGEGTGSGR
ncbi:hypothetical protein [Streptomyces sp. JJ36]|uniref:hypothetical protein n=1 Tax=Streptomyces sp. JJ36 TaxID=2736645 RepID=UPI001F18E18B|nr:hypothetical protein [Streptomyces sp. JJ36]MCF6525177.1 hypothetical protein [Streptomyces sp. JJ36]